jgi:hypothetical protein
LLFPQDWACSLITPGQTIPVTDAIPIVSLYPPFCASILENTNPCRQIQNVFFARA